MNSVNTLKKVALSAISRCSAGKSSEEPASKKSKIEPASGSFSLGKAIKIMLLKAMNECKEETFEEAAVLDELLNVTRLSEGQQQDLKMVWYEFKFDANPQVSLLISRK